LVASLLVGKEVGVWQGVGVALVGGGVILVRGSRSHADRRGFLLALAIAAAIAGYTLVDKEGIQHAAPIPYLELVLLPAAVVAVGVILAAPRPGAPPRPPRRRPARAAPARLRPPAPPPPP